MGSTFMGLETSKRGLSAQQSGLYTTGHNISNANTIGYSRQTVNLKPTNGFPGSGMNAPQIPGYLGTGATPGSIQRVRDQFIDNQFRQETTKLGYWGSKSNAISQMEDILSEPSTYGLNTAFDALFKSFQDLSAKPENSATRQVVAEKANHFADTLNYLNTQLTQVQTNLKNEITAQTKNINSILKKIAQLNEQISNVEPNGYLPNDLYDARDNLVDELSQYLPIKIDKTSSGGNSKDMAEGIYNISLKLADGSSVELVKGIESATLVPQGAMKDENATPMYSEVDFDGSDTFTPLTQFKIKMGENGNEAAVTIDQMIEGNGVLNSLATSYGTIKKEDDGTIADDAKAQGLYIKKLDDLDTLVQQFATAFNDLHKSGYTLAYKDAAGNDVASVAGEDFFVAKDPSKPLSAKNIQVSPEILKDLNKIAASSTEGAEGNGTNATALSNLKTQVLAGLNNASAQSFYQAMIADLGIQGEQAVSMSKNLGTTQLAIANNRASISAVSLDEEMTNMIMYQQAYNASARMLTVMDETLEKIINGMGRVGL